jgi:8-oxo-dGTP pyrophosphatase MutT (NUDIX family)
VIDTGPTLRPASTVVLLREGAGAPELLMVRRNRALAFAGGFWVFPGGAVDREDREAAAGDMDKAARIAAAREAAEEAGLHPDPGSMVLISHWTTPVGEPKRFATWIYAAPVPPDEEVVIDRDEIHDYQWLSAPSALGAHRAGALALLPPTYITLCALASYKTVEGLIAGERESPCPRILPLLVPVGGDGGFATLYPGDVAYEGGEIDASGPRHRAYLERGCWHYQYEGVVEAPPLFPLD